MHYFCATTHVSLDDIDPTNTSFLLLLSDLSQEYYQAPSMNRCQVMALMKAFAKIHAHFWKRPGITDMQRGGFWVLERRLLYKELDVEEITFN